MSTTDQKVGRERERKSEIERGRHNKEIHRENSRSSTSIRAHVYSNFTQVHEVKPIAGGRRCVTESTGACSLQTRYRRQQSG